MVDSSLIKVVSSASAIEEVVGLENVVPVHHIHSSDMRNLILNTTKGANF